ncbi:MAG TPA: type II secretion system protein GspN [Myxococcaceae bacterium]|nr:type II secretion system protein GspN [Myxococcaceae bacterium]
MLLRRPLKRWEMIAGYAAFGVFAFFFLLYLTFPYSAVERRLAAEANNQGLYLKFGGLGPGFFGMSASTVQVSKKFEVGDDAPQPIVIRSVSIRPSLSPLGVAFRGNVFGGKLSGSMGWQSDVALRLELENLNPSDETLKTLSGLDLAGRVNSRLSLEIPKTAPTPTAKVREPDLSQAKGTLSLNLNQLVVNGGTVKVPIYGEMTPLDLPKISIGEVEAKINFQKGMGTIEKFQAKGTDLDLIASGTLRLSKRLEYSEPNVDVKLKLDSDFTKRLGIVAAGLSTLPEDKENPGFRVAKLTGFLGKPNFNPGR